MAAGPSTARALSLVAVLAVAALAVALLPARARALQIEEGFEWGWAPACVSPGEQAASCASVAGCAAGRDLLVRRTSAGACHGPAVRFWVGGPSHLHSGSPEEALAAPTPAAPAAPLAPPASLVPPAPPAALAGANEWVATHVFDPGFARPNDDVFEILSTREPQSSRFGRLQVDLHVPADVRESGTGEHYLVLHNLNLTSVAPCPADGPGCDAAEDVTTSWGGLPGHPGSYLWYGVIAGSFGAGTEAIPYGSVGFAVEVSAEGAGGNHLVGASFLPYSVEGRQETFPSGWYRISIERSLVSGEDTYAYDVARWDAATGRFAPIVPDGDAHGGGSRVSVPFADLVAPIGFEIPPGYVGLAAAWLGERRAPFHVDWDNLVVRW